MPPQPPAQAKAAGADLRAVPTAAPRPLPPVTEPSEHRRQQRGRSSSSSSRSSSGSEGSRGSRGQSSSEDDSNEQPSQADTAVARSEEESPPNPLTDKAAADVSTLSPFAHDPDGAGAARARGRDAADQDDSALATFDEHEQDSAGVPLLPTVDRPVSTETSSSHARMLGEDATADLAAGEMQDSDDLTDGSDDDDGEDTGSDEGEEDEEGGEEAADTRTVAGQAASPAGDDIRAQLLSGLKDDTRGKLLAQWAKRQQDSDERLQLLANGMLTEKENGEYPGDKESVASGGVSGAPKAGDGRPEKSVRKKEMITEMMADEALVQDLVRQHLKDEAQDGRAGRGPTKVNEAEIRERLSALAAQAEEQAGKEEGDQGVVFDPRDVDVDSNAVVHTAVIADLEDSPTMRQMAAKKESSQQRALAARLEQVRPGPGGVLVREDVGEQDEEEAAYDRLLTSADTRRQKKTLAGIGRGVEVALGVEIGPDGKEIWNPGGEVRAAFHRSRGGLEGGGREAQQEELLDEADEDPSTGKGKTGQQLLGWEGGERGAETVALARRVIGELVHCWMTSTNTRKTANTKGVARIPSVKVNFGGTGGGGGFLFAGVVYKRSSADGWGGVARWRKRMMILHVIRSGQASDEGPTYRGGHMCIYFFRLPQKEKKSILTWGRKDNKGDREDEAGGTEAAAMESGEGAEAGEGGEGGEGGERAGEAGETARKKKKSLLKKSLSFLSRTGSFKKSESDTSSSAVSSAVSTPSVSSDAGTPKDATTPTIPDSKWSFVLEQTPRVICGTDLSGIYDAADCGEPVGNAAVSMVSQAAASKKGESTVKLCFGSKAEKARWVQALQFGKQQQGPAPTPSSTSASTKADTHNNSWGKRGLETLQGIRGSLEETDAAQDKGPGLLKGLKRTVSKQISKTLSHGVRHDRKLADEHTVGANEGSASDSIPMGESAEVRVVYAGEGSEVVALGQEEQKGTTQKSSWSSMLGRRPATSNAAAAAAAAAAAGTSQSLPGVPTSCINDGLGYLDC